MKIRSKPIEPMPDETLRNIAYIDSRFSDPRVTCLARSVLIAIDDGCMTNINAFSRGFLAVIATY